MDDAGRGVTTGRREPGRRPMRPTALIPPHPRTQGSDPDYRFTLANERTFLSWIRTALALAAAGLGATALLDDIVGEEYIGLALLVLSVVTAALSYRRWALSETAMRLEQPLPASRLPLVLAIGVASIAVGSAILIGVDA